MKPPHHHPISLICQKPWRFVTSVLHTFPWDSLHGCRPSELISSSAWNLVFVSFFSYKHKWSLRGREKIVLLSEFLAATSYCLTDFDGTCRKWRSALRVRLLIAFVWHTYGWTFRETVDFQPSLSLLPCDNREWNKWLLFYWMEVMEAVNSDILFWVSLLIVFWLNCNPNSANRTVVILVGSLNIKMSRIDGWFRFDFRKKSHMFYLYVVVI